MNRDLLWILGVLGVAFLAGSSSSSSSSSSTAFISSAETDEGLVTTANWNANAASSPAAVPLV